GLWTPIPPEVSADETAKPVPAAKKPSHQVVRITGSDAQRPAEVAVAVSPENPDQLIAISHQSGAPWQMPGSYAYIYGDGGATWEASRLPEMPQRHQGDDAVTFGLDRTAYRAFLSFNGIRQGRPQHASTGVFVSSSRDGATWSQPVAVVDHVNSV